MKKRKKKKTTPSEISVTLPAGWGDLTDRQLTQWTGYAVGCGSSQAAKTMAALEWSGLRAVCRVNVGKDRPGWLFRRDCADGSRQEVMLEMWQVAAMADALGWTDTPPECPMRPSRLAGRDALEADFSGVPFGTWLTAENLWQGVLHTRRTDLQDQLADILYPPAGDAPDGFDRETLRFAAVWWWRSLKAFLGRTFPEFFRPEGEGGDDGFGDSAAGIGKRLRDSMNAQIRALTKGDVTKEEQIMNTDTWRALTELDAMAREYRELKNADRH